MKTKKKENQKIWFSLGMVRASISTRNTLEDEAGGAQIPGQPALQSNTLSQKQVSK
jgi:hypothetical protein